MNKPDSSFIDCFSMSEEKIIDLVKQDYLQFCLHYRLGDRQLDFSLADGTQVHILDDGIIVFDSLKSHSNQSNCKHIILSCGVHGNETAPIEICNQLIKDLTAGNIHLSHRVMFLFGNIPSMLISQRFVEENLNRLFIQDTHSNSLEGHRAHKLMAHVDAFFQKASERRYHYDLHTAIRPSKNEKFAVYPYLHGKAHSKEQLAFLSQCEVNTILLSQTPTGTFSYFSSYNYDAHAFTVELGKVRAFGENDMRLFTAVIENMQKLLSQELLTIRNYDECPLEVFTVNQVINKQHNDFRLHFADDIANFTGFAKGEKLASETGKTYFAEHDGEAIVFPNAEVAIGQRALLTVIPYAL